MDPIRFILKKLPDVIVFEGITFNLNLLHASDGMQLCYSILGVDKESPHFKTFQNQGAWISPFSGELEYHLFAETGIKNMDSFMESVLDLHDKLKRKKIIESNG